MFAKSIRGRILLWLAFLLVCILAGFGLTAYQLHRTNRFRQIDDELARRLAAVSSDLRPPFGVRRGGFPRDFEPHPPWHNWELPPDFAPFPNLPWALMTPPLQLLIPRRPACGHGGRSPRPETIHGSGPPPCHHPSQTARTPPFPGLINLLGGLKSGSRLAL